MEKKKYIKPETETLYVEMCQMIATSFDDIQKADNNDDIEPDDNGFYWAE